MYWPIVVNVAACKDEPEIARYLLSTGADPHAPDEDGWAPIWSAARYGHAEVVRILAEAGADVESVCGAPPQTPLHAACEFPEAIRALLENGADINHAPGENTPLARAVVRNQPETVKMMLRESKKKPDLSLHSNGQALVFAVSNSYVEAASLLLEAGADVNFVSDSGFLLLSYAMPNSDDAPVRTLLEYRPDLEAVDAEGNTALHFISSQTPVASVRLLINAGANLSALNKKNLTPLMSAVLCGNHDVVEYMLTREGAMGSLNMPSFRSMHTPLHLACQTGTLEIVQSLVQGGSDVNFACTGIWGSPLMAAAQGAKELSNDRRQQIIELLLEKGADPTLSAGLLGYPIISASLACSAELVKLLLDCGASASVQDPFQRKPVHLACYNSQEVLYVLDVPDSDFAARDVVGRVPLHYAVLSGEVELLDEVLARSERVGIGIDVRDKDGWTPLLWAARASAVYRCRERHNRLYDSIISFLLAKGADTGIYASGILKDWTALDVAYYHSADRYVRLLHPVALSLPPETRPLSKWRAELVANPMYDVASLG